MLFDLLSFVSFTFVRGPGSLDLDTLISNEGIGLIHDQSIESLTTEGEREREREREEKEEDEKAEGENGRRIPGDKLGKEKERRRSDNLARVPIQRTWDTLRRRVKNLDRSARRPLLQYFA